MSGRNAVKAVGGALQEADGADPSKKIAIDLSAISTATTRTLTVPDANVTISAFAATLLDDADATTARTTLDALQTTGSLNALTYDRGVTGSVRKAFEIVVGPDTVNWREFLELDGTDETAKMQAFVNACSNKRGICTSGEVKISSAISIDPSVNFIIEGVGNDPNGTQTTRIRNINATSGDAIVISDPTSLGADNFRKIARLGIFGNQNSGRGIFLDRAFKVYLDELWISSHGGNGVYAYRSFSSKLNRVISTGNGGWGVYFNEQANNVSLTQCIINGNSRNTGNGNIYFNGSSGFENLGVLIQDCDFTSAGKNAYGGGDVLEAYNLLIAHTYSPTVQNCYSEQVGSPSGAGRLFYAGPTCRGLTMINNYWQDGTVEIDGAREVRVENNLFNQVTGGVSTLCKITNSAIDEHDVIRNIFIGGATYSLTGTLAPYMGWGAAAPVTGTWRVGDKIRNTAPVAGGTEGWICTTAGTPGTWKTFGTISA